MWKEGNLKVNEEIFHYCMKQYEKGSKWGIEGGRISKLSIRRNGKEVYNYDRGLDIAPVDENTELAMQILVHTENY